MFNYNLEKKIREAESIVNYSENDHHLLSQRNKTGFNNQNQQMIQKSFLPGLGYMTLRYKVCVCVGGGDAVYGMHEAERGMCNCV